MPDWLIFDVDHLDLLPDHRVFVKLLDEEGLTGFEVLLRVEVLCMVLELGLLLEDSSPVLLVNMVDLRDVTVVLNATNDLGPDLRDDLECECLLDSALNSAF